MNFGKIEMKSFEIISAEDNGGKNPLICGDVIIGGKKFEFEFDCDGEYMDYSPRFPFIPQPIDVDYYDEVNEAYKGSEQEFAKDRSALFSYIAKKFEKLEA